MITDPIMCKQHLNAGAWDEANLKCFTCCWVVCTMYNNVQCTGGVRDHTVLYVQFST